ILFAGNKFPIGVEAPQNPIGIEKDVHIDPKEPQSPEASQDQPSAGIPSARPGILESLGALKEKLNPFQDKLKSGPGLTQTALTWEPAKEAARKMEKKIQDQLEEAGAEKSLRSFAFEMALFGTGVYKGPFAKDKEYPRWTEDGTYDPEIKQIADME